MSKITIGLMFSIVILTISLSYAMQEAHPSKYSGGRPGKIIMSEAGTTIFQIEVDDRKFNITVTGEGIKSLVFSKEEKSIVLENNQTDGGALEVDIEKELLNGEFTVIVDEDKQIEFKLSETETHSVLLFERPYATSTITIEGTTVIPEFPVTVIVFAGLIAFVLMIVRARINVNAKQN